MSFRRSFSKLKIIIPPSPPVSPSPSPSPSNSSAPASPSPSPMASTLSPGGSSSSCSWYPYPNSHVGMGPGSPFQNPMGEAMYYSGPPPTDDDDEPDDDDGDGDGDDDDDDDEPPVPPREIVDCKICKPLVPWINMQDHADHMKAHSDGAIRPDIGVVQWVSCPICQKWVNRKVLDKHERDHGTAERHEKVTYGVCPEDKYS